MMVNLLFPVVPAAPAVKYARPDLHLVIFILNYIAMVPCANLIGFAGQELGRKLPRVVGILSETTLGSVVEIVLFMVLLKDNQFPVIQAAILGSILATMLLCLGLCFFWGGLRRDEQCFEEAISETGNGLLLVAGFGLIVPSVFHNALSSKVPAEALADDVLHISRITSICLILSYVVYVYFNMRSHHSMYDDIFEADEQADADRHWDLRKAKLTFTECIFALTVAIALVSLIAIALVDQIPNIVEGRGVSETFMGLILVPLVEKAAEHLTAIDEAWDNTMNIALAHVLGATVQTALFNGPLVIIAAWGLGKDLDLNFDIFTIVVVILSIIVVGNFLKDQKSNYLEGALSVFAYVIIAVAAYYYPNISTEPAEPAVPAESAARRAVFY